MQSEGVAALQAQSWGDLDDESGHILRLTNHWELSSLLIAGQDQAHKSLGAVKAHKSSGTFKSKLANRWALSKLTRHMSQGEQLERDAAPDIGLSTRARMSKHDPIGASDFWALRNFTFLKE